MSKHTEQVRVNPPESPDGWHYQLQDDSGKRKHSPVLGYASWEDGIPRQEALANATMWAAAPQLLEACKEAAAWLENHGDVAYNPDGSGTVLATLRAAIARATSEEK